MNDICQISSKSPRLLKYVFVVPCISLAGP
jgi:hypothetical protein